MPFGLCAKPSQKDWSSLHHPASYYKSKQALDIADKLVLLQRQSGGWSKRINPGEIENSLELAKILASEQALETLYDHHHTAEYNHSVSTFDDRTTSNQIRFLLRIAASSGIAKYLDSAKKGLEFVLQAQHSSGGWPQNYPNTSDYGGLLTFNDNATVGVMRALKEAYLTHAQLLSPDLAKRCQDAFYNGIKFILKSQLELHGKLTGWAQQYNHDLQPAQARSYEKPAIASYETVEIVKLLIEEKAPSGQIKASITGAIQWLHEVNIHGFRISKIYHKNFEGRETLNIKENPRQNRTKLLSYQKKGYDKVLLQDNTEKWLWARFYDLNTMQPVFFDWDEKAYASLNELSYERRVGYLWYGQWAKTLLTRIWPKWQRQHGRDNSTEPALKADQTTGNLNH